MDQIVSGLTQIANRHKTDKGTVFGARNSYTLVYDLFFRQLKYKRVRLLEIGLNIGGPEMGFNKDRVVTDAPSLKTWLEFFPEGIIHGLDISDFSEFENERFQFHQVDCGDASALKQISDNCGTFDIIIDDGSHASFHQQQAFTTLFKNLSSGGLYIIEDLSWQPSGYEESLPKVPKTADLLYKRLEQGTFSNTGAIDERTWDSVFTQVESVHLIDHRTLVTLGRNYNAANCISSSNWSNPDQRKLFSKPYFLGIVRKLLELVQSFRGDFSPLRPPHIKLAIIQRK